jgi:hypothetical protein
MKQTVHKITLILFIILFIHNYSVTAKNSFTQNVILQELVNDRNIKTIRIHREDWKLSYPIIELNGTVKLDISFDDLSGRMRNYSYKIIHCDHQWKASLISENEYITGHLQNQILDYSLSFNTYIPYVHYKLKLPNDDLQFRISGNYLLLVYENFDEENVVFQKRFIITETIAEVSATVKRPILSKLRDSGQEIDFQVNYGTYPINDPFGEINVTVLQNGRYDNAITGLKPLFFRDGLLEYDYDSENVFPGSSEFRWFDTKSTRYQSPYIQKVEFINGAFHVQLFPDEKRSSRQYFFEDDLNGKYYIEVQEQPNDDLDADYVYVYFSFKSEVPLQNEKIYLLGSLVNWLFNENSELIYNPETKAYEITLLLKQGYYNYQYVIVPEGHGYGDQSFTEGNHYETENDYIIIVYHRSVQSRYDRVIGYQIVNSIHR